MSFAEGLSFWLDGNREYINDWRDSPLSIPGSDLWKNSAKPAPFDQEFYLTFGLAVGGRNHFSMATTPWDRSSPQMKVEFYRTVQTWYPSWIDETKALEIKSVKVFAL